MNEVDANLSNAGSRVKANFAITVRALLDRQQLVQSASRATSLRESRALLAKPAGLPRPQKRIPTFRQART